MAKRPTPDHAAAGLTVRERVLLFCIGSGTDWPRAGVTGETETALVVKGLLARDAPGHLALTDEGRATLRALLPDLQQEHGTRDREARRRLPSRWTER